MDADLRTQGGISDARDESPHDGFAAADRRGRRDSAPQLPCPMHILKPSRSFARVVTRLRSSPCEIMVRATSG